MKSRLLVMSLITACATFAAHAQTSGGTSGSATTGGSAGTAPGTRAVTTGTATDAAGSVSSGTSVNTPRVGPIPGSANTGTGAGAGSTGREAMPGADNRQGVGVGVNNGTVTGTTPVSPGLQVGPGWQPVPGATNQFPANSLSALSNQFGIASNVTGIGSSPYSNRFGAMTNRFGTPGGLLPTSRLTNNFDRILQDSPGNNQPGTVPGNGTTAPLPGR